jgi:hypothetical protein
MGQAAGEREQQEGSVTHLLVPVITLADLPPTLRKRVVIDTTSGCWRAANGFHDRDGYAQYHHRYAHKAMWERFVGPVPDGHNIDHVRARGCIWRDCVFLGPDGHLDCVPIAVNNLRSDSASARNARKDACNWGHEFDLINTRFLGDGRRECIACDPRRAELNRQSAARRRLAQTRARAAQTDVSDAWDALLDFGRAA